MKDILSMTALAELKKLYFEDQLELQLDKGIFVGEKMASFIFITNQNLNIQILSNFKENKSPYFDDMNKII